MGIIYNLQYHLHVKENGLFYAFPNKMKKMIAKSFRIFSWSLYNGEQLKFILSIFYNHIINIEI